MNRETITLVLTLIGIIVTVISVIVAIVIPEVRCYLGLQQENCPKITPPEPVDVSDILNPKRGQFEKQKDFDARRERLVADRPRLIAEFNQASQQGDSRYQVGVAYLKDYNADTENLVVTVEWQATWVKPFSLPKSGMIKMAPQVAKTFWQRELQKPLYVQIEMIAERLKIKSGVLISNGQVWYITFLHLPDMVIIPADQFLMGDIQGTIYGSAVPEEQPVHQVSVKSFAMSRHEVTFEEYDYFAEQTGREKPSDKGWGRGNRPVINVSWDDATAYADWLSGLTGEQYRLPTEAEWEYAARAGTKTYYWWGNEIGSNRANCYNCSSQWDNKLTAPVCSFAANQFGLCDTAGNVSEWTCSEYEEKYNSGKELKCISKKFANGDNQLRVIRGGNWSSAGGLASSSRFGFARELRFDIVGFRLARM